MRATTFSLDGLHELAAPAQRTKCLNLADPIRIIVGCLSQHHVFTKNSAKSGRIAALAIDQLTRKLGLNIIMAQTPTGCMNLDASFHQGCYGDLKASVVSAVRAVAEATVRQLTFGARQAFDCLFQIVPDRLALYRG